MARSQNKRSDLIVSIGGGLGNQLFQFAAGLALTGKGVLGLETALTIPTVNAQKEPELFSYTLPENVVIEKKRRKSLFTMRSTNYIMMIGKSAFRNPHIPGVWLIRLAADFVISIYMRQPLRMLAAKGIGYHEISKPKGKPFLVGYFQSYRWPSEPEVFQKLQNMTLKDEGTELPKYRSLAEQEKPLIVHVRLGDYKLMKTFGIPSKEYYRDAIEYHIANKSFERVWVVSNEIEQAKDFLPKELIGDARYIEDVENSASKTFELMRMGNAFVIGNSTYSWWAAFLSKNENPLVVAPTPWFQGEPSPIELLPPHWRTIEAWQN